MYLAYGRDMLSKLNGIFAFAIWDKRDHSLLIARDAMGVKPLYYSTKKHFFSFASEIKSLLSLPIDADTLDCEAIHRYLTFLWCPGDGTPLKEVRKLLPGEAIIVRFGEVVDKWIWYQPPMFNYNNLFKNRDYVIKETALHLQKAVERQMVADVPVGAFLSGGLDSSAVVAFASKVNPNIHCFTIEMESGNQEGMVNDLPYAKKVAGHLGVPLQIVKIDAHKMADDLQGMVLALDEPLADPAALNVLYICQLARKQGIKVLLSGVGGDDLFSGYRRHQAIYFEKYWNWLPKSLRITMANGVNKLDQRNLFFRRITKLFAGAGLSPNERLIDYYRWIQEDVLLSLYTVDFRRHLAGSVASKPIIDFLNMIPSNIDPLEKMLAIEKKFFLADHNLIYTDKMSMAAGVEVRVPFLDLDLIDFASKIPVNMKQHGREGKWILKKAMEPYLPREVIYRPKTGFGAPLRRWMRSELRDLMGDLLSNQSLMTRGIFDFKAVGKLIQENDAGTIDATYTLFSLMCIEIWCRGYVDKKNQKIKLP